MAEQKAATTAHNTTNTRANTTELKTLSIFYTR
jgi:hypothetical protein